MSAPVALISGASRGLGFSLGVEAARRGFHVVAIARTVGGLEELDDAIRAAGGSATLTPLDVTDDEALPRLGAALNERFGRLDLWMHAAVASAPLSPASHAAGKDFDKAMAVNARATLRLIRMLEPLLKAAPAARAVRFDDVMNGAFTASYGASQAAARAIWDAWEAENERSASLRVITVLPPPMPTALRARFWPGEDRGGLTPCDEVAARVFDALEGDEDWVDLRRELDDPDAG